MRFEYGIGGEFSWPITDLNTLDTKATTTKSVRPVIIAIGKSVSKDFLVFKESPLKILFTSLRVLLCILICNHKNR